MKDEEDKKKQEGALRSGSDSSFILHPSSLIVVSGEW